MIRKLEEVKTVRKPGPFNGNGEIVVRELLDAPEQMYHKGRVFAHTTIYPGSSIGYHIHEGESETYYILSGTGILDDNGSKRAVVPGDVAFTGDGEGHGIENTGDVPIELIALILYNH